MHRKRIIIVVVLLIFYGIYQLYFDKELYEPNIDLKKITSITGLKVIDTVYNLPFETDYVYEKLGPQDLTGDPRKEYLFFQHGNSRVHIALFRTNNEAVKKFISFKSIGAPVFNEGGTDYNQYFVKYIEQGEADQYGLFLPIDHYYTSAGFLKQNMVIYISSNLNNRSDESLKSTINHVEKVLKQAAD